MAEWWEDQPLHALSAAQWEALCDGCARCCLHKLEDENTGEVFYTSVHCRNLDEESCRCTDYSNRQALVPDCIQLHPDQLHDLDWLPDTCAYRLRAHGRPLADWHPLVSGTPDSVHQAGVSIRGRVISEEHVHPDGYSEYIVRWVN